MGLSMPKMKSHSGTKKRFKVTGSGKVLRRKQGKRHLLQKKNRKRKRNLGKATLVSKADLKNVKANLPFS